MSELVWDKTGEKTYETGVDHGVLYPYDSDLKKYGTGVPWNGLTSVDESPEGADATALYADNIKYLNLVAAEEFKATIEAYTYPPEFEECDGSATLVDGITVGQQPRKMFGLSYRTVVGNDTEGEAHGYKIHLVYGCTAAPSDKSYETINDSPDAIQFSWEVSTVPVNVTGKKPTATLVIDSTKLTKENMTKIEQALYGTADEEPTLLTPDEIVALIA